MSGIDYSAIVSDLREKREAIDTIIDGFQRLLGAPTPVVQPEPRALPKPKAAKVLRDREGRASPRMLDPKKIAEARKVAAEHGLGAASRATGIGYQTLYGHSKRDNWKLPKRGEAKVAAIQTEHKGPIPSGKPTGKLRVCERCQQKTIHDPCAHCGAPWNRVKVA